MMMPQTLYNWLGPDAERIWQEYLIEQAARDAEALRHMAEANDE